MKEERVYIRIEDSVKRAWVKRAKDAGMSLSDYIRYVMEGEEEEKEDYKTYFKRDMYE